MTGRQRMTSRTTRAVVATLAVAALGLGVTACTGSDNGGVIQGPPPPAPTTTTTVVTATTSPAFTTTTALPGGTLPSS
jgi:hypothetical protein